MGTAQMQGALWGARARDWADILEGTGVPAYEAVLREAQVGAGTRLLDVGCGAGMAAALAAGRGAKVTGLDAAETLVAIARERVPDGDFRVGEIEDLPYPDETFDVVTGFNAFQYAASPAAALMEAKRVAVTGGRVAMVVWGREEQCEHTATLAALKPLLPPPPPGAGGPFALSAPGLVEDLMRQAGLEPVASGEVPCPFRFPDLETAVRGLTAAGPTVQAAQHAGEEPIRHAIAAALAPYRTSDGGYLQRNVFRYVVAVA